MAIGFHDSPTVATVTRARESTPFIPYAMSTLPSDNTPLTEDEAHRILARAAELDSRMTEEISVGQLQQIAEEAGIGARSLEQALREWRTGRVSTGRVSSTHGLSEQMARFRRHAIVAFVVAGAFLSPGDVISTTLVGLLPAMALYELVLRLARRSRPGSPPQQPNKQSEERAPFPVRLIERSPHSNTLALLFRQIAPAT